jgi:hypothetical protein
MATTKRKMDTDKLTATLKGIAESYKRKDAAYWNGRHLGNLIGRLNGLIEEGIADSWQISVLETTIVLKAYFGGRKVEYWEFLPKNRKLWFKNVVISSDSHEGTIV